MSNRNRTYSNGTITVVWQPAECIHAGECFTTLRKVFDPVKRPWVRMDGAPTEAIIDTIERCPSKALTFFWNDPAQAIPGREQSTKLFNPKDLPRLFPAAGNDAPTPASGQSGAPSPTASPSGESQATETKATRITYRPGCPLVVEGDFTLLDETGAPLHPRMKMVSLCRCGLSDNQPFCDGAHFKAGFRQ